MQHNSSFPGPAFIKAPHPTPGNQDQDPRMPRGRQQQKKQNLEGDSKDVYQQTQGHKGDHWKRRLGDIRQYQLEVLAHPRDGWIDRQTNRQTEWL